MLCAAYACAQLVVGYNAAPSLTSRPVFTVNKTVTMSSTIPVHKSIPYDVDGDGDVDVVSLSWQPRKCACASAFYSRVAALSSVN